MHLVPRYPHVSTIPAAGAALAWRLSADSDSEEGTRKPAQWDKNPAHHEDLPYRVELWDAAKGFVEQVLAVTAHGSIGYAAYYAATREYPERYVTLRHKGRVISRWNGPRDPGT